MIAPLAVVLALNCPVTVVENVSGQPWDAEDQKILDTAKIRCGVIYPDAPCVKWFQKRPEQMYRVICGAPKAE